MNTPKGWDCIEAGLSPEEQVVLCREALQACQKLFEEALPKFNWPASFLDARAIRLLNEVPQTVQNALALTE